MKSQFIPVADLFQSEDMKLYPEKIELYLDIKNPKSEIDIVITAHNLPNLTNLAVQNYLTTEKQSMIHIIVVESSGSAAVFNSLLEHPRVSKILLKTDIRIKGQIHGYASYGMSLSAQIGLKYSNAPYVFFSHSDMLACKENFLTFLKSKLVNGIRLASFTQRHIIPFTGCMLVQKNLLLEQKLDWIPKNQNTAVVNKFKKVASFIHHFQCVDSGESFVYHEILNENPVHVCASRGGSQDWWKHPLDYYETPSENILKELIQSKYPIVYAPLTLSKEEFEKKHGKIIQAGYEGWWLFEKPKWWRYSFDDEGDLVFIHHGRGTTLRAVKRWLKFGKELNRILA